MAAAKSSLKNIHVSSFNGLIWDPSQGSRSPSCTYSGETHCSQSPFHLSSYKLTHDEEPEDDASKSKQEEGGNFEEKFAELHYDVEPEEDGEDPEELLSISLIFPLTR